MGTKLYVGNLPFNTTSEDLEALFSSIGSCESASVITDRATGRSRGFGFVAMATDADAQKAIAELDGADLDGRPLRVNIAEERKPRTGGGGGGGGGFNRRPGGGGGDRGFRGGGNERRNRW